MYRCSAGYNIVVVETVGLGQSEIDVDLAVDMVNISIMRYGQNLCISNDRSYFW